MPSPPGTRILLSLPVHQSSICRALTTRFRVVPTTQIAVAALELGLGVLLEEEGTGHLEKALARVRGQAPRGRPKKILQASRKEETTIH
jgi:hypothetical protein